MVTYQLNYVGLIKTYGEILMLSFFYFNKRGVCLRGLFFKYKLYQQNP